MISPARHAAFRVLCRVELSGAYCDELLNSPRFPASDERDRNLATEICYGTLRWQLALDDVLARISSRPWEKVDPRLRILLRLSLYQLWHADRIPEHALVNDAVDIAKFRFGRGCAAFVNGLLRRLARERPWEKDDFAQSQPDWIRLSLPKWLWDRWSSRFGRESALRYAASLNRPPQCAAWCVDARESTDRAAGSLSEIVPGARLFERTPRNRHCWIQDEASQLIPHLLLPIDGKKLWDACAAPGGKAGILNMRSGESGLVIASDVHLSRVRRMKGAFEQFKPARPVLLVADAESGYPFRPEAFDGVLADVPCSGLGTLRRNPEIRWRFDHARFAGLQTRQRQILSAVSGAVRRGGALLYSTCSTEPEENEQVVDQFLAEHREFRLGRPVGPPGVDQWLDEHGFLRTYPSDRLWDGFFAALMFRFS